METRSIDAPIVNVAGARIALGPVCPEHLPAFLRWLNDFDVLRTTSQVRPLTPKALEQSYERSTAAADEVHFAIFERGTWRLIGSANLTRIGGRTAEFAIAIGEKDCWGKGYGTEATRLVLDYGFNALGLHNIMLKVHDHNERGLRAYRRAGFREIGRRREVVERAGRLHDLVYMDCLASEFESAVLQRRWLDA